MDSFWEKNLDIYNLPIWLAKRFNQKFKFFLGLKGKLNILKIALVITTTCAFGQFIIEESLQCYGFGVFVLVSNALWSEAEEAVLDYEAFYIRCLRLMQWLSTGSPITSIWFNKYMEAEGSKIHYFKKVILHKTRNF